MVEEEKLNNDDRITRLEHSVIEQESRITKIINNLYKYGYKIQDKTRFTSTLISLSSYLLKRQAITIIISLTSGLLAILGCYLAYKSNQLIKIQNELFELQNDFVKSQNYIIDADRKSSRNELIFNLVATINSDNTNYSKTDYKNLELECINLSGYAIPYQFRNIDTYSLNDYSVNSDLYSKSAKSFDHILYPFSPERGLLFMSLANSSLPEQNLNSIYRYGTFDQMLIQNGYLLNARIKGLSARMSSMQSTKIENTIISNSRLIGAGFQVDLNGFYMDSVYSVNSTVFFNQKKGSNITIKNSRFERSIFVPDAYEVVLIDSSIVNNQFVGSIDIMKSKFWNNRINFNSNAKINLRQSIFRNCDMRFTCDTLKLESSYFINVRHYANDYYDNSESVFGKNTLSIEVDRYDFRQRFIDFDYIVVTSNIESIFRDIFRNHPNVVFEVLPIGFIKELSYIDNPLVLIRNSNLDRDSIINVVNINYEDYAHNNAPPSTGQNFYGNSISGKK